MPTRSLPVHKEVTTKEACPETIQSSGPNEQYIPPSSTSLLVTVVQEAPQVRVGETVTRSSAKLRSNEARGRRTPGDIGSQSQMRSADLLSPRVFSRREGVREDGMNTNA